MVRANDIMKQLGWYWGLNPQLSLTDGCTSACQGELQHTIIAHEKVTVGKVNDGKSSRRMPFVMFSLFGIGAPVLCMNCIHQCCIVSHFGGVGQAPVYPFVSL